MPKRGRLSDKEEAFIKEKAGTLSAEEIAKLLDRMPDTIQMYIDRVPAAERRPVTPVEAEKLAIRQELRGSVRWSRLKQELTAEEILFFEEEYVKLMAQFKNNVLHSEETQVFDVIKFEILKSRNMIERRKAREDITRLEKMQETFLKKFDGDVSLMSDGERAFSLSLDTQLQSAKAAEQNRTTEYVKLQERQDALMKSLRAVREQRIKEVEDANVSFLGVVKMIQDRGRQAVEGRQMELMKRAQHAEHTSLGRPVTFDDGSDDNPILSADTVHLSREGEGDDSDA